MTQNNQFSIFNIQCGSSTEIARIHGCRVIGTRRDDLAGMFVKATSNWNNGEHRDNELVVLYIGGI